MSTGPVQYAVYDPATGEIRRAGVCASEDLQHQVRSPALAVCECSRPVSDIEDRIVAPANGRPYARRRSSAEIASRREHVTRRLAAIKARPSSGKILAALVAKGLLPPDI